MMGALRRNWHWTRFAVAAVAALFLFQGASFGQVTGDLEVKVQDPSNAAIAGASITLTSLDTGTVRQSKTDNAGTSRFTLLNVGRYEIRVDQAGFDITKTQAEVNTGAVRTVVLTLEVQATRQEVVVESSSVAVNTEQSQLQTTTSSKALAELPLLGTGVLGVAGTTPGVVPVTPRNPFLGLGSYNSNGGRGRGNNITVDSAIASDVSTTGGAGLGTVPQFLIKEVNVISNNFSAEFGRNSSSQFQILTKSGTNEYHGQVWEFLRNNVFNSRDYFDRTGKAPTLRDNQFGAYFGGPIVKNKLFAIGHWEQQKIRGVGAARIATTWTPAEVAAITDPTSRRLFEQVQGSRFTSPSGTSSNTSPLGTDSIAGSIRMDWNITDRDTLFGRWGIQDTKNQNPGLTFVSGNLPTVGANSTNRPQNATLNYTRTFSPTVVWNSLAAFGRSRPGFLPLESFGGPQITINDKAGSVMGIWSGIPQGRVQNTYQFYNTVTIGRGRHTLKAGYDVGRVQANSYFDSTVRGAWTFATFADFAAGRPQLYQQRFGNSVRGNRNTTHSAFFQDDWKATRTLTINLGVRLEVAEGVTEVNDLVSNLNINRQGALGLAGTGPLGTIDVGGKIFNNNYNWGPRLGFAWNPGSGKTVFRGGFGTTYDFIFLNPITNLRFFPPFMYLFSTTNFTGSDTYANLVAGSSDFQRAGTATVGTFGTTVRNFGAYSPVDQGLRNPQVHQWNFTIEREMMGLLWRASYIGTKGNFLQRGRPINTLSPANEFARPTTPAEEQALIASGRLAALNAGLNAGPTVFGARIDPRFNGMTLVESSANSNYHGFQFWIQRRFSRGFGFSVSYTLGKSIDDNSDVLGVLELDSSAQQNPFNNKDNRAVSAFDVPQRFVVTHNWELPFFKDTSSRVLKHTLGGWSLNGIFQTQGGIPVPFFSGSRVGAAQFVEPLFIGGGGALRPNLVGPLNVAFEPDPGGGARNPNKIPSSGLAQPLLGNFGTLGRNVVRANGLTQYDWTLLKNFQITERFKLQFQAQMYNLFNNTSFSRPGQTLFSASNFGYYQDTSTNTRNMTMVMTLMF
jgi:hypothetical protein